MGCDFYKFVLGGKTGMSLSCVVLCVCTAAVQSFSLTAALFTAPSCSKSPLLFCLYWLCQTATELKNITALLQYL